MQNKIRLLAAGAALLAAACTPMDAPERVTAPVSAPSASAAPSSAREAADRVAHAFALALGRREARVLVRNAMRASPLTEHKLVLQDFLATPAGRTLLAAAARESGSTPEALLGAVAALPRMDFYAPFREHRLTWRGGDEVTVGATLHPDSVLLTAYRTDGTAVVLDSRRGVPALPLLVMHPAERSGPRVSPQPGTPGEVIQDPGDGEISGTVEWTGADGRVHVSPIGRLGTGRRTAGADAWSTTTMSACDPTAIDGCDPSEETSVPGITADTTFLDAFSVSYGDGWSGSMEVELYASYYPLGSSIAAATGKIRMENVARFVEYYPHKVMVLRKIPTGSGDRIRIRVVETDTFFDDDKGSADFFEADRGRQKLITSRGYQDGWGVYRTEDTMIELDWVP